MSRVDPAAETRLYTEEVLRTAGQGLDAQGRALLEEDLRSPCTEEIAVFRAFARVIDEGKDGFEWWIVEPSWEGKPVPDDIRRHVSKLLTDFAHPMPDFAERTDFDKNVFRWEVYNRPSMKKWSKDRVICIGDAVHPVSPYAAYGMGMAIEDGYYLGRALAQVKDLANKDAVTAAFTRFERERVDYVNHNMEFARYTGYMFHSVPRPLAWLRDLVLDYTPFLSVFLKRGYLENSEKETMSLSELFVSNKPAQPI